MHNANATSTPVSKADAAARKDSTKPSTVNSSATSTPEHRGRDSPANSRSSRRDSLTDPKPPVLTPAPSQGAAPPSAQHPLPMPLPHAGLHPGPSVSPGAASETSYDGGNNLLQEYQRQKMRYHQEAARDNRLAEER